MKELIALLLMMPLVIGSSVFFLCIFLVMIEENYKFYSIMAIISAMAIIGLNLM